MTTSWQACKNGFRIAVLAGAFGAMSQAAMAVPVLSMLAAPDPAVTGTTVGLDVAITGIADLYGYQFSLAFDPTILQATDVSEGGFLASAGGTSFYGGAIDNVAGAITFAFNALSSFTSGANGSGVLEHITFDTLQAGVAALSFSDTLFLDSSFADIAVLVDNRTLTVISTVTAVPESGTYALMALGLAVLAFAGRRKAHR